jgi:hypothetical protein
MSSSKIQQPASDTALTDPVRYPVSASPQVRTKRGFVLVLMTLLVPGSAQLVAGDRKLGRAALRVTLCVWAALVLAVILLLANRPLLINLITNPFASLAIIIVMVALAAGWAILFINTLRLIRPVLLAPPARPAVVISLVLAMVLGSGSLGYAAYLLNVGRNALGSIFSLRPRHRPGGRPLQLPADGRRRRDSGRIGAPGQHFGAQRGRQDRPDTITFSIPRNFQNAQFQCGFAHAGIYPEGFNCGDECIINAHVHGCDEQLQGPLPGRQGPRRRGHEDGVSGTLGIDIQAYVLVDMDGFEKLIDAMGGIRIKAGNWVPISTGSPSMHHQPASTACRRAGLPGRAEAGRLPCPVVRPLARVRRRLRPHRSASNACRRP